MEERTVRHEHSWEISATAPGHDVDELLRVIDEADTRLWVRYGEVGTRAA